MNRSFRTALGVALATAMLAACTGAPVREGPAGTGFDPLAAVAVIRAAGNVGNELVVTPLGDAQVVDLRALAQRRLEAGDVQAAADSLDEALALTPDDPALLQERAELALLLHDREGARALAGRAVEAGSGVGPYCRRHWETLHQVALSYATVDPQWMPVAEQARTSREACTVAPPPRY